MYTFVNDILNEVDRKTGDTHFGRVANVVGLLVEVEGLQGAVSVSDHCDITTKNGQTLPCEVVGFRDGKALVMPFGSVDGIGMEDDAVLKITESGDAELRALLTANVRAQASETNKLIVALKFRFLHLLDETGQRNQADILIEGQEIELARLDQLRQHHAEDGGYLLEWLDYDIQELESRLAWLRDFRDRLG